MLDNAQKSASAIEDFNAYKQTREAIGRSQAIIEFELDGTIITVSENLLSVLGYELSEIQGRHHSVFVDPPYVASAEYKEFWAALGRGEFQSAEYKRLAKGGKEAAICGRPGFPQGMKMEKHIVDLPKGIWSSRNSQAMA